MVRIIELFSGAGLLGQGFKTERAEVVYACDLDADAVQSYNANAKKAVCHQHRTEDIRYTGKCDLIVAGPPCQGFSSLGKQNSIDERNLLSLKVLDWALATEAQMVVIENVPLFLKSPQYRALREGFYHHGYEHVFWVLDAADYHTPQHRKRSIAIFSKIELPLKPSPSKQHLSVGEAFKGLNPRGDLNGLHQAPPPTELARERFRHIPRNGGKVELMQTAPDLCPPKWFEIGKQAVDVWGRMDISKPSNTIRCSFINPSKGRYIHPFEDRVITLREGARLQGIPDHWHFSGSRGSIARQIGNGVPIPLARAVAQSALDCFA